MGLGLPSGSGAEWAAGLGTPVAGCQLPLFWDLERMPWKGGGVASMGIRRPSCLWEPEKGRGCSQLLLCLVCRPELAGAASLPSFNGCCICSDLSPGGGCGTLFLPIADRAAGPRSQVLAGRAGRGPCPAPCMDLRPETAISASLQVGPGSLRGWCQRRCVPSPSGVTCRGSCQGPQALLISCPLSLLWGLLLPWALPSRHPVRGGCSFRPPGLRPHGEAGPDPSALPLPAVLPWGLKPSAQQF